MRGESNATIAIISKFHPISCFAIDGGSLVQKWIEFSLATMLQLRAHRFKAEHGTFLGKQPEFASSARKKDFVLFSTKSILKKRTWRRRWAAGRANGNRFGCRSGGPGDARRTWSCGFSSHSSAQNAKRAFRNIGKKSRQSNSFPVSASRWRSSEMRSKKIKKNSVKLGNATVTIPANEHR